MLKCHDHILQRKFNFIAWHLLFLHFEILCLLDIFEKKKSWILVSTHKRFSKRCNEWFIQNQYFIEFSHSLSAMIWHHCSNLEESLSRGLNIGCWCWLLSPLLQCLLRPPLIITAPGSSLLEARKLWEGGIMGGRGNQGNGANFLKNLWSVGARGAWSCWPGVSRDVELGPPMV